MFKPLTDFMEAMTNKIVIRLIWIVFLAGITLTAQAETRKAIAAYEKGDYALAYKEFRKSAFKGDLDAQYNLAVMLYKGNGVSRDKAEAVYWFLKAAEQGDASAQYNLGVMYANDQELPNEYPRMANGELYFEVNTGKSSSNVEKSAYWYKKAAEQGHVAAQLNLGVMYNTGAGVKQDYGQAARWYEKAAAKGNAKAELNLGILYDQGLGVSKDLKKAYDLYRKAAARGVADAQYNLGILYYNGEGVKQDYIESYAWLSIAADQGSQLARVYRDRVFNKLKKTGKARAKRLAQTYKNKYVTPNKRKH